MSVCLSVCRVHVECVQYTAAAACNKSTDGDDVDESFRDALSADEVTQLLQQVLSRDDDDHQLNLLTSLDSTTERDVLHRLRSVSVNNDDNNDDERDLSSCEFVVNVCQFVASSSLSLYSYHKSLSVIRGQTQTGPAQ